MRPRCGNPPTVQSHMVRRIQPDIRRAELRSQIPSAARILHRIVDGAIRQIVERHAGQREGDQPTHGHRHAEHDATVARSSRTPAVHAIFNYLTMRESSSERELILSTVRRFVQNEVLPVASGMEHRNEYPHQLVEDMRKMGLFGLNVPEEYGGANVDYTTFAMVFEELSK